MDTLHEIARWAHIGIGTLAFASLWTAGFARKGGHVHRRAGRIYVMTMVLVLASAGVLTSQAFLGGQWMGGIFLVYLLTITGTALWMGKRALRFKGNAPGYAGGAMPIVGVLNILAAGGAVTIGIMADEMFIAGISAIGFLIGFGALTMWRKPPDHPRFWLKEHIGGMIGAGIATHVAFASIGLRQLFPEVDTGVLTIWPWAAPLIIGFAASAYFEGRYVKRGAPLPAA